MKTFFVTYKYVFVCVLLVVVSFFIFVINGRSASGGEVHENDSSVIQDNNIKKEESDTKHKCDESSDFTNNKISVDVKGAVKNPGVYEMDANTRVVDAIRVSGGIIDEADTTNINLSKKLSDEMVIVVYTVNQIKEFNEKSQKSSNLNSSKSVSNDAIIVQDELTDKDNSKNSDESCESENKSLVSINTGTREQLMTVKGIGEAKAIAIIEYRTNNGYFKNLEDIKKVSGIGESLYEKIKQYITI